MTTLLYGTRLNLWLIAHIREMEDFDLYLGTDPLYTTLRRLALALLYAHVGCQWMLRTICAARPL